MRDKLKQRIIDDIRKLPTLLAVDSVIEPAGCVQISLSYGLTGEVTDELSPREPRRVPAEQVQFEDASTESWSETFRRAADWIEQQESGGRSLDVTMITGELYFNSDGEGLHVLTIFHETANRPMAMLDTENLLSLPSTDELAGRLAQVVIDTSPSRTFQQIKVQMRGELLSAGYPIPACEKLPAPIQAVKQLLEHAARSGAAEDKPEGARYIQVSDTLASQLVAGLNSLEPPNPDASLDFTAKEASRGPCDPARPLVGTPYKYDGPFNPACGQPERDSRAMAEGIETAVKTLWHASAKLGTISSEDFRTRMSEADNLVRRAMMELGEKLGSPAETALAIEGPSHEPALSE